MKNACLALREPPADQRHVNSTAETETETRDAQRTAAFQTCSFGMTRPRRLEEKRRRRELFQPLRICGSNHLRSLSQSVALEKQSPPSLAPAIAVAWSGAWGRVPACAVGVFGPAALRTGPAGFPHGVKSRSRGPASKQRLPVCSVPVWSGGRCRRHQC